MNEEGGRTVGKRNVYMLTQKTIPHNKDRDLTAIDVSWPS